jgi:hypothetical protein
MSTAAASGCQTRTGWDELAAEIGVVDESCLLRPSILPSILGMASCGRPEVCCELTLCCPFGTASGSAVTGCMVADRTRVLCVYHRQVGQFLATARVRTLCGRRRPAQKFRICRNKPCTDYLQEYAMHGRVYFPLPPFLFMYTPKKTCVYACVERNDRNISGCARWLTWTPKRTS